MDKTLVERVAVLEVTLDNRFDLLEQKLAEASSQRNEVKELLQTHVEEERKVMEEFTTRLDSIEMQAMQYKWLISGAASAVGAIAWLIYNIFGWLHIDVQKTILYILGK